jgi:anti-anti-sigma factor
MSTSAAMPKTSPSVGLETDFTCGAADFTTFWLPPSTAIVAAVGELDAANAAEFTRYAWRSGRMTHLVVDLSGVEFCGSAGYSALLGFGVQCAAQGVGWALVPSRAVKRVLGICDPDGTLPVYPTVKAAMASWPGGAPLLELIPQPR